MITATSLKLKNFIDCSHEESFKKTIVQIRLSGLYDFERWFDYAKWLNSEI